jgi:hypothetical protein
MEWLLFEGHWNSIVNTSGQSRAKFARDIGMGRCHSLCPRSSNNGVTKIAQVFRNALAGTCASTWVWVCGCLRWCSKINAMHAPTTHDAGGFYHGQVVHTTNIGRCRPRQEACSEQLYDRPRPCGSARVPSGCADLAGAQHSHRRRRRRPDTGQCGIGVVESCRYGLGILHLEVQPPGCVL